MFRGSDAFNGKSVDFGGVFCGHDNYWRRVLHHAMDPSAPISVQNVALN
jgi:hypothetical protein